MRNTLECVAKPCSKLSEIESTFWSFWAAIFRRRLQISDPIL